MKLIDALRNVDRSSQNEVHIEMDDLANDLGLTYFGYHEALQMRVKGYSLTRWNCTDAWVGFTALYLDGEPVGTAMQPYRRSSTEYHFLSEDAADRVRNAILLFTDRPEPSIIDPESDIPDTYGVDYAEGIIDYEAFYEGRPVQIVEVRRTWGPDLERTATRPAVRKVDGPKVAFVIVAEQSVEDQPAREYEVAVRDLRFPLRLSTIAVTA